MAHPTHRRTKREQRLAARREMVARCGCVICKELFVELDLFCDIVNESHHIHGARVPRSLARYIDQQWLTERAKSPPR